MFFCMPRGLGRGPSAAAGAGARARALSRRVNLIHSLPMHRSVIDLVGGTPLVRLRKVVPRSKDTAKVFAKLESLQPNSSVKDR